jgi:hypothetical protein
MSAGRGWAADEPAGSKWEIGRPIVTYWAGPGYPGAMPLNDASAAQLAEGNWNLAWASEAELEVAARHGLRAMLQDGLLNPAVLDDPAQRAKLDALVDRVKSSPAMYAYFLVDEPSAGRFAELGRLVSYLRERDPAHLAYINLLPTYATPEQLGTSGDTVGAYNEHLRQFIEVVQPSLLSYDHYQFAVGRDMDDYFLNLKLMRAAAQKAGLPFLNIVQACTWTPGMREPGEGEMRYLVYTSLAYGAQGISYYVYSFPGHTPGIVTADGTPTAVYGWLRVLNQDFAAIGGQLQGLRSLGVFHAGMQPPGAEALSAGSGFQVEPALAEAAFRPGERVEGVLIGEFGGEKATHAVVVNLDYKAARTLGVRGPGALESFEPATGEWKALEGPMELAPGGGRLVRVRP